MSQRHSVDGVEAAGSLPPLWKLLVGPIYSSHIESLLECLTQVGPAWQVHRMPRVMRRPRVGEEASWACSARPPGYGPPYRSRSCKCNTPLIIPY